MRKYKVYLIHIGLFLLTIITTTLAGGEWLFSKYLLWADEEHLIKWTDFVDALHFSIPFLMILTFHEFGHYFVARMHKVSVTLPFYIPLWLGFILLPSFGTMGAFIRIRETIYRLKHYFDIGIAGPLAGFVIAFGVIFYGYTHLPEPEYVFKVHPEYAQFGKDFPNHVYTYDFNRELDSLQYVKLRATDSLLAAKDTAIVWGEYPAFEGRESYEGMHFGKPLLFILMEKFVVSDADQYKIPVKEEIMHYPYLLAGILALFFTALNLLPIGQLDGGHILFGMIGPKRHEWVSKGLFVALLFYSGLGVVTINDLHDTSMDSSLDFLISLIVYVYALKIAATSLLEDNKDRWLFAAVMLTVQFVINAVFDVTGYMGWLLFAIVIGRFLGVKHPMVYDQEPLSKGRMVLGVLAFIVFILSFSPEPFVIEFISR